MRFWIFGDSFSTRITGPYLEYEPDAKIFSQLLGEKYDCEVLYASGGGADNYTIIDGFIEVLEKIKEDDVLIFGWSEITRFRLPTKEGHFRSINAVNYTLFEKEYQIPNISNKTYYELFYTRAHKVYHDELSKFIKLINYTFRNNIIIHWSWVDYEHPVNLTIKYFDWESIFDHTNRKVYDFHYSVNSHRILFEKMCHYIDNVDVSYKFKNKNELTDII